MSVRDTYRDMLHDNGFCIMRCMFSALQAPLEHQITLTMIQSVARRGFCVFK